ncbi:hypothetical protein AURDEDRAFT_117052 [Auricularia subglabra TFB-10046 SS5]|nr:hypothetical protein AURDEDRAFT_117052 [Auricularia subglabra TFB-10046 SS5]
MAPTVSSDTVGVHAPDDETTGKKRKKKSKDKDKERRKRKERDEDAEADGEPKKRSKKRVRDADADADENDDEPVPAVEPVEDEHPRKKRRKKKKDGEQATTEPAATAGDVDADASIDPVLRMLGQPQEQQARDPNEEILQILQSVDISKIDVDALFKNAPPGAYYPAAQPLPADDQPAASSSRSSSKGKSKSKSKSTSSKSRSKSSAGEAATHPAPPVLPLPIRPPGPDIPLRTENTPEHVAILTTKWMSSKKLEQLIRDEGLLVKKGKFSLPEEQAVKTAVEKYRTEHNLTEDELQDLIFAKFKRDGSQSEFWTSIALQVPQRPLVAIYHWVKRVYNPLSKQGRWSADEDNAVIDAVGALGQAWEKVSERVGRTASDCRDRWRNHLHNRDSRNMGVWTPAEEADLTRIVREMTLDQGKTADSDIFWTEVARRMDNRRSRQQCRVKWTDSLNKRVKNDGEMPRWTHDDGVTLIYRVEALGVQHDSEINWLSLNDEDWNLWSAHQLQRRWQTMKRAVHGHEQMPLRELLDALKGKKGLVVGDN